MSDTGGAMSDPGQEPRVLVVPASYYARHRVVGGGERYALAYARALAELTPTTLALFDRLPSATTDGRLWIRTFTVRDDEERWGFPATPATRAALREFEVLHAMVFPTPATDWLVWAGRRRRQIVVLTDVGGGGPCWSARWRRFGPWFDLNRRATGLALLSHYSAERFGDWSTPKVVLHGGIDPTQWPATSAALGDYALYVGRLLPHKGVLPLIQALAPTTPLRVVGRPYDPAYRQALEAAAHGRQVRFHFAVEDAELRQLYAGARLLVQPSLPTDSAGGDKSELLGLATLEGMASGRPVVVTRAGSLPELVVEGETGWVVPPSDPAALRKAVERLMADRALAERMGAAARRHVSQHFTWEAAARRGLQFYRRLARPGREPTLAAGPRSAPQPEARA